MTVCARCGLNEGTEKWVGEGGVLALSHGFYEMWCKRCVLTAQIEYAEKAASRLADLREQFAALPGSLASPPGEPHEQDLGGAS